MDTDPDPKPFDDDEFITRLSVGVKFVERAITSHAPARGNPELIAGLGELEIAVAILRMAIGPLDGKAPEPPDLLEPYKEEL
jgi:hypothetical protein